MTLKQLNKKEIYTLGNMTMFFDSEPEYSEPGWYILFEFPMSYKILHIPFDSLDKILQDSILNNIYISK